MARKKTKRKKNPCWKGYEAIGMKKKGGRTVPNCVPNKGGKIKPPTKAKISCAKCDDGAKPCVCGDRTKHKTHSPAKLDPPKSGGRPPFRELKNKKTKVGNYLDEKISKRIKASDDASKSKDYSDKGFARNVKAQNKETKALKKQIKDVTKHNREKYGPLGRKIQGKTLNQVNINQKTKNYDLFVLQDQYNWQVKTE